MYLYLVISNFKLMEPFDDTETSITKQFSKTKPFSVFCQLNISKYRQKYSKCTTAQINNILAQDWAKMSLKKRRQYVDIAAQYEQDLAVLRATNRSKGGKQNVSAASSNAMLSSNFGAIPPTSSSLHQQSSNSNMSGYINPSLSSNVLISKGKGKQKRSGYGGNGLSANQRSKIDADGDYIPQSSSRSAIPAPILDDLNSNINEADPLQEMEESIKLVNFSNLCLSLTSPISTFDCSWYSRQPILDTNH